MSRDRLLLKAEISNVERFPTGFHHHHNVLSRATLLGPQLHVSNLHKTKKNFSCLYNYGLRFLSWFVVISDMLFIVNPKTG